MAYETLCRIKPILAASARGHPDRNNLVTKKFLFRLAGFFEFAVRIEFNPFHQFSCGCIPCIPTYVFRWSPPCDSFNSRTHSRIL